MAHANAKPIGDFPAGKRNNGRRKRKHVLPHIDYPAGYFTDPVRRWMPLFEPHDFEQNNRGALSAAVIERDRAAGKEYALGTVRMGKTPSTPLPGKLKRAA